MSDRDFWNGCRFDPATNAGHYESYFQRANHPSRPLAFWIRYTIFCPKGRPQDAVGELWAIYFDAERDRITAVKERVPYAQCRFSRDRLDVQIVTSVLDQGSLRGSASSGGNRIDWDLRYGGGQPPALLLDRKLYGGGFPKAKVLAGMPLARFDGALTVDGERVEIDGWVGSQNHNWGKRHTDRYAWGQVAGFDDAPDAFLELGTGRVKVGPLWTPWFTMLVLRAGGEEYAVNTLGRGVRARARFGYFDWSFATRGPGFSIRGKIDAPRSAFVGLTYDNPPGGAKLCLNSKLARCEVTLERDGAPPSTFRTAHRAAFEILTEDRSHGVPIRL